MWWQRGCLVLSLTAAFAAAPAAQPAFDAAVARTLAASAPDDSRSLRDVAALTEIAGARLTGTATYERAAAWAVSQFREAGVGAVVLEPFAIGRGWQRESARGRMVAPVERPLQIASLGWMPSTPDGGIEAEVVVVRDLRPDKIAAQASLKGRIALLPEGEPYWQSLRSQSQPSEDRRRIAGGRCGRDPLAGRRSRERAERPLARIQCRAWRAALGADRQGRRASHSSVARARPRTRRTRVAQPSVRRRRDGAERGRRDSRARSTGRMGAGRGAPRCLGFRHRRSRQCDRCRSGACRGASDRGAAAPAAPFDPLRAVWRRRTGAARLHCVRHATRARTGGRRCDAEH